MVFTKLFARADVFFGSNPPANYTAPPFPSLHWPLYEEGRFLYGARDMTVFTLLWTLSIYMIVHVGAAALAITMHLGKRWSNWKYVWIVPIFYILVAGSEAVLAGGLVGAILSAVYMSGPFQMSTWVPFVWGLVNVLVLIISSFSIQGGL